MTDLPASMIERAARAAMNAAWRDCHPDEWDQEDTEEQEREHWREVARTALEAALQDAEIQDMGEYSFIQMRPGRYLVIPLGDET